MEPGPSTWEAGDYRDGQAAYPVTGVSWYEAAAYARFVGQQLPTAHHWQRALANSMFPWLLPAAGYFIPMFAAANAHSSARSAISLSVGR
jgi:hypothetical protein